MMIVPYTDKRSINSFQVDWWDNHRVVVFIEKRPSSWNPALSVALKVRLFTRMSLINVEHNVPFLFEITSWLSFMMRIFMNDVYFNAILFVPPTLDPKSFNCGVLALITEAEDMKCWCGFQWNDDRSQWWPLWL